MQDIHRQKFCHICWVFHFIRTGFLECSQNISLDHNFKGRDCQSTKIRWPGPEYSFLSRDWVFFYAGPELLRLSIFCCCWAWVSMEAAAAPARPLRLWGWWLRGKCPHLAPLSISPLPPSDKSSSTQSILNLLLGNICLEMQTWIYSLSKIPVEIATSSDRYHIMFDIFDLAFCCQKNLLLNDPFNTEIC